MLVFVDESGDAGMMNKSGSSPFFIVTAILFRRIDSADACDARIVEIRRELKVNQKAEFHFNKCRDDRRLHFFDGVLGMDFSYVSLVLDKARLREQGVMRKDSLYRNAIMQLFESARPDL